MRNLAMFAAVTIAITPILTGCNGSTNSSSGASADTSNSDSEQTSTSISGNESTSSATITSTSKVTKTSKSTTTSKATTTTITTQKPSAGDSKGKGESKSGDSKGKEKPKSGDSKGKDESKSNDSKANEKPKSDDSKPNKMADDVVKLVNKERKKAGLKPLKTSKAGNNAAQLRAVEIEKSFSHNRPDGSSCFTVADEFKINSGTLGETLLLGIKLLRKLLRSG